MNDKKGSLVSEMSERVLDMQTPGADVKARKTRASKPKVKTGCQTCKIRRVKCDETKPSCLRCLKFGHQCDGYVSKPSPKAPQGSPSSSRVLVPKASSLSLSASKPAKIGVTTIQDSMEAKLYPAPSSPLFRNTHEHLAFTTFCASTSHTLSFPDLWTRLMLQACETSPSIRHAVIALGALPPAPEPVGTLKHQFAFRQYNKALCLLSRDVAGGKHDLRTTLIASLLFYCFESFHGYHELAISQVYTGLKLIREWASSFYAPGKVVRLGSENPYEVEDDIVRAFGSLEIQVMLYADGRTREAHEHYRRCGQPTIDEMPAVFPSLEAAKGLLEMIIRRSMHWLRSTMHLHTFSTKKGEGNGPMSLFFDVDPTFDERQETLKEFERWDSAFQPLLNHARRSESPRETFILASTLRLHWLAGYMSIASNNSRSALVNNGKYTVLLQELVGNARLLLDEEAKHKADSGKGAGSGGYVFDMQIIVPLLTVGWIYRHRALRREAIELLMRSPRKEGVWDGIVVGKIMGWLTEIEEEVVREGGEEGESEEYVPEWAATRCIRMNFDAEAREARVSCLQPVRGSLIGEERKREVVIPW